MFFLEIDDMHTESTTSAQDDNSMLDTMEQDVAVHDEGDKSKNMQQTFIFSLKRL